jgi:hypothetical protein
LVVEAMAELPPHKIVETLQLTELVAEVVEAELPHVVVGALPVAVAVTA